MLRRLGAAAAAAATATAAAAAAAAAPPPPPSTPTSPAAAPLCVTAGDGSVTACVDPASGSIVSVAVAGAPPRATGGGTTLGAGAAVVGTPIVAPSPGGGVTVTTNWTFAGVAGAPAGSGAVVVDTLFPSAASVGWRTAVDGTAAAPWSVPVVTNLTFADAGTALKLWAPWDRDAASTFPRVWTDPLQPSDVRPAGWWDGCYRLGNSRGAAGCDYVTAPLVTVLSADPAAVDDGFTVMLSPTDPPLDVWLYTHNASGGFTFERQHHRIAAGTPVVLAADIAGHAADWRAAVGWATAAWPAFYEPVNPEVFDCCAGTGSYSWYIGPLNTTDLDAVDYAVNWDLSGRFFPYMGMYLPPVLPGVEWLNDPEGSQSRANVSYESIGAWYRTMADAGYTDLSYFNINEYGINIVLPPPPPAAGGGGGGGAAGGGAGAHPPPPASGPSAARRRRRGRSTQTSTPHWRGSWTRSAPARRVQTTG
jgi:hypothetical protein